MHYLQGVGGLHGACGKNNALLRACLFGLTARAPILGVTGITNAYTCFVQVAP